METSFTKGTFLSVVLLLFKIVAAKIGREAFLEPDIVMDPESFFFPLMISFCIKYKTYTLGKVTPFCFIYLPFLLA